MATNIGYLFYREYYKEYFTSHLFGKRLDEKKDSEVEKRQIEYFTRKSEALFSASKEVTYKELEVLAPDPELRFQTTYPGLLIGSGYSFGSDSKGEFKLGFYFDHSTGMPVIPGSSVKGLLRSAFPGFTDLEAHNNFNESAKDNNGNLIFKNNEDREQLILKKEKALFTWWIIKKEEKTALELKELNHINDLEYAIFEGKTNGEYLSIYQRDIFHDAYIRNSQHHDKRVLGSDYITPHKHKSNRELDPFVNPIPVMFIKILPQVEFQFNFQLRDNNTRHLNLDSDQKKKLFINIIETLGIGAKTNVGYGQFKDKSDSGNINIESKKVSGLEPKALEDYTKKPKTGDTIIGKVTNQDKKLAMILMKGEEIQISLNKCPDPIGTFIKIKFGIINKAGEILGWNYDGKYIK
jgi:CRISPR-associated protein Cmr6